MALQNYNDLMKSVTDFDYIIGLRKGEGLYLKRRDGFNIGKMEPIDFIQLMLYCLPEIGVEFFDDAAKEELRSTVEKILTKHNIGV